MSLGPASGRLRLPFDFALVSSVTPRGGVLVPIMTHHLGEHDVGWGSGLPATAKDERSSKSGSVKNSGRCIHPTNPGAHGAVGRDGAHEGRRAAGKNGRGGRRSHCPTRRAHQDEKSGPQLSSQRTRKSACGGGIVQGLILHYPRKLRAGVRGGGGQGGLREAIP